MCTLTVQRTPQRLLATMNRDETLVRGPEVPPEIRATEGRPAWMSPRDSDHGGTWMGANAHGVVACLLNAYLPGESLLPDTTGRYPSRGKIIPTLLEQGDGPAALAWLGETFEPEAYPSFTLLVITPDTTICYEWLHKGRPELVHRDDEWLIRSSAGWDSEETRQWREECFAQWRREGCASVGALPQFHIIQDPKNLERSPLMSRDWSGTRSITQAEVSFEDAQVAMRYWPNPTPRSDTPTTEVRLDLTARSGQRIDARAT